MTTASNKKSILKFTIRRDTLRNVRDELMLLLQNEELYSEMDISHKEWDKNKVLVARTRGDKKNIGFMFVVKYDCEEMILITHPNYRRIGVATALFNRTLTQVYSMSGELHDSSISLNRRYPEYKCEEPLHVSFIKSKRLGGRITYAQVKHEHDSKEGDLKWTVISPIARFVRLTNATENHNGFQYQDGMNVMCEPFTTDNYNGLYFCTPDDVKRWIENYEDKCEEDRIMWVRDVFLPPDARVIRTARDAFKADKFVLGPRKPVKDWLLSNTDEEDEDFKWEI